jgi:hypothetical protein
MPFPKQFILKSGSPLCNTTVNGVNVSRASIRIGTGVWALCSAYAVTAWMCVHRPSLDTILSQFWSHPILADYRPKILSRVRVWRSKGFGLVNRFIDYFCTRLGTASNYSAIVDVHYLQITAAPSKPFPACCVFTSRYLVTASNSVHFSASRPQVLSPQPPMQNSTELIAPSVLVITSRHRSHRKHPVSTVTLLLRAYSFTEPLPRNGRCLQSRRLATGLYARI